MKKNVFTKSSSFTQEYCCTIVKIGEIKPIENSDFLGQTMVTGESIVVRKDQVKEGDVLFYSSNETELNKTFLSKNNLFEMGSRELNENYKTVQELIDDGREDEAKRLVGFFPKTGRVRMIRLRGVPSMGYLFTMEEMLKFCPQAKDVDLTELINEDFDTVNGELFVKAYIPRTNVQNRSDVKGKDKKRQKKIERFDRMVKNEFLLHYSTDPLAKNIYKINPTDDVTISVKLHGTSAIYANVKVKEPLKLPIYQRIFNKFVDITGLFREKRITDYEIVYGNVYSSRTVIKNQYINKGVNGGFYGVDIWAEYNDLLKYIIPKGMTVYGEICGYLSNSETMIQNGYDYGCEVGQNFLMPYRITTTNDDGSKKEWSVRDVANWAKNISAIYPQLEGKIRPIDILYEGTLMNLYPKIDVKEHWHENILEALRSEKKLFGMEQNERFCKTKVPREGIVLRIEEDPLAEAFKLKCQKFLDKERKNIDEGIVDFEMDIVGI